MREENSDNWLSISSAITLKDGRRLAASVEKIIVARASKELACWIVAGSKEQLSKRLNRTQALGVERRFMHCRPGTGRQILGSKVHVTGALCVAGRASQSSVESGSDRRSSTARLTVDSRTSAWCRVIRSRHPRHIRTSLYTHTHTNTTIHTSTSSRRSKHFHTHTHTRTHTPTASSHSFFLYVRS
jgi:hypothetical protein